MGIYETLQAIEEIAEQGYLSQKEIQKLTRIKNNKKKSEKAEI